MTHHSRLAVVHSATELQDVAGQVVVTGSHGGLYPAGLVAVAGASGALFNDASGGLDDAGFAGLALLETATIPAVVVSHLSATIGNADSTLAEGIVSHANPCALSFGCAPGISAQRATQYLLSSSVSRPYPTPPRGTRRLLGVSASGDSWAVDSAAFLSNTDATSIIFCGSHGGLVGGQSSRAVRCPVRAIVFNDAGGGPHCRGRTRLPALDDSGIPAATVAAATARIGDGLSTYTDGVISAVNNACQQYGLQAGMPARALLQLMS
jgi:hypothetical protein